ncbi:MAG: ATP-binding protein [Steroidobacteraceae bacterium]
MIDRRTDEASARLAAIVESSDDAIIGKTLEGVITSWNRGAQRLFGYSEVEVLGRSVTVLIPDELLHEETEILSSIRAGNRVDHYQTRRRRKDGSLVDISLTVSPVKGPGGEVIGASKIARDVSVALAANRERDRLLESERAARAEAERLGFLKDEFLATLSHELRTPLNAIIGWCALLREPGFRGDSQQAIGVIERNARAQAQIIDDLLDMSRIVAGKIALELRPLSLDEVVTAAADSIRPSATAKAIELSVRGTGEHIAVNGDPARLQQVLWNLLTNAVKFTPSKGRIEISLRAESGFAEICVTDSGVGIPTEFLPEVFDRFRQAQSGSTRQYGGLGLGLSIVQTLAMLHGGRVRAESGGADLGSRFTVQIPLLSGDASALETEPASALPDLSGRVVLVVDDDDDSRGLLVRILQQQGARVHEAPDAATALQVLANHKVQAMLSDLGMPGTDGFQLMRKVRSLLANPNASVPAVAVSAYARPEDRRRAIEAGFHSHIAKPISVPDLLGAVDAATRSDAA